MNFEETENLKLQYVNRIETNTTHISNIQESDTDLVEKITEILNIYEKHPNFKGNQNNRIARTNLKNIENQTNHSINI